MQNPVIAEVTRGGIVESRHRGSFCVSDGAGRVLLAEGDIQAAVFPRSAFKAFQCLPVIESGAADRFGMTAEEIALCCASHNGEPEHVRVAASLLAKAGNNEENYECGAQWPHERRDVIALGRHDEKPRAIHNNCSGKHAGMLALTQQLGVAREGYVQASHEVQRRIAATIEKFCDVDISAAPVGVDGCSVPTWALPLRNMALGFARLVAPGCKAGHRIVEAVRAHPEMIEGPRGFDTRIMQAVPRLFIKYGAEAVYCGAISHAGLGFALKIDDGSKRAAQVAVAGLLGKLDVWTADEAAALKSFAQSELRNWRDIHVGDLRAAI